MSITLHTVRGAAEHALQQSPYQRANYATLMYATRRIRDELNLSVERAVTADAMLSGAWYAMAAARPEWGVTTEQMAHVFWVQLKAYRAAGWNVDVPTMHQAMKVAMQTLTEVKADQHVADLKMAMTYTVGGKPISDHSI